MHARTHAHTHTHTHTHTYRQIYDLKTSENKSKIKTDIGLQPRSFN